MNSVAEVRRIEQALEAGGAPDHTRIWAMLETPIAMLDADGHRHASERLAVLVMGTNDLAKELQAEHVPGRQPLLTGLGLCLLAARAAGKVILDGVYNDIKDDEGFEAECEQGRELGFDGKTLIHPSQVEPCNPRLRAERRGGGAGRSRSSPRSRRRRPTARAWSPSTGA